MKKSIQSTMSTGKKKVGVAVLCGALFLTMGTMIAFAAEAETQTPPEIIKEDIVITTAFRPNPAVYAKYDAFGIAISEDGVKLLYEGQPVRMFADEKSDTEVFYFDEAGDINLSAARNTAGEITGIERITDKKAQEFYAAFFADEPGTVRADPTGSNKYDRYHAFGITYSVADEVLSYNGQRVKFFVDQYVNGQFEAYWTDEAGTINLAVVRDASGQITGIETISDLKAQEMLSKSDEPVQSALTGLDEKIENRMKELFPDS